MNKLLGSIISKFDAEAKSHMERQSLNPFSGSFNSRSPSPRLAKDQYGRPLAGSKTEERGQKAKCHILREILDLCNCIHDLGVYNKVHKPHDNDSDDEQENNDDEIIITFGEIFQMYTKINDKVVGLLIAAKKRGFLFFEKEMLFQRRDDDVLIALIKPISEIRAIINRELQLATSPVPTHSRNDSPVVGNDTKSDKSTYQKETLEEPSKSGSGSPVENKVDGEVTETPKELFIEKVVQTDNKGGDLVQTTKNGLDDIKTITGNKDSAHVVDGSITQPEIQSKLLQQESDSIDKQEAKLPPHQVEIQTTPTVIQITLEEHTIPLVEVTCEESYTNKEDFSPKSAAEPTEKLSRETIPSIEITKAPTPERSSSEEPSTHEFDRSNQSQQKSLENDHQVDNAGITKTENNNTKNDNVEVILNETNLTSAAINSRNVDLSMELSGINPDLSSVLSPENLQKMNQDSSLDVQVSDYAESSTSQIVDSSNYENQDSGTSLNDNERKRTLSNEELIESLTASLNIRSSSPDPCDEEVEQIFQSQVAVNPHFCEPLQEMLVIQEPSNSSIAEYDSSVKVCDKNSYLCISENSDEFKTPVSEVISDPQTPEIPVTPEVIFSTPDNSPILTNLTDINSVEKFLINDVKEEIKVSQVIPLSIEPNLDSALVISTINIVREENINVPLIQVSTHIDAIDNRFA